LNYRKAGKSTSQGAFRIELQKIAFLKEPEKKQSHFFWLFQKQKHFKSQTKHPLNLGEIRRNPEYQCCKELHKLSRGVETHNFNTGRRNHDVLELIGSSRQDFRFESIFLSFIWIVSFHYTIDFQDSLLDAIWKYDAMTTSGHIRPPKKGLPNIDGVHVDSVKMHSSPWLVLSDTTYSNVVYVPAENAYIYNNVSPLIPQVALMHLTLHGQHCICYENVFTSYRRCPQDIPRSPRPRWAVVASHTIDTQPLPHDRDYPQSSLILRGWVRDSHHPVRGNLTSYLVVGASLHNSKL
jgi:hypothetical protein